MIENEQVVAGLRRHQAKPRHDRCERMLHPPRARRAGRRGRTNILRREEGRIDHHRAQKFVAEVAREAHRDPPAERMADDDRRPGVECAAHAPRCAGLPHELLEHVMLAPVRASHAGEGRGHDPMIAGEKRRDERPPVGVRRAAVQEHQSRLAALAPGQEFDLRALDLDEGPLRLLRDRLDEPRRRRGFLAVEGRKRRHQMRIVHEMPLAAGFENLRRHCEKRSDEAIQPP